MIKLNRISISMDSVKLDNAIKKLELLKFKITEYNGLVLKVNRNLEKMVYLKQKLNMPANKNLKEIINGEQK